MRGVYARRAFSSSSSCKTAAAAAAASTSKAATPVVYPFSSKVKTFQTPPELIPNDNRLLTNKRLANPFASPSVSSLRKGINVMPYIHRTLPSSSSHTLLSTFFARRGRGKINPGSVLTLTLSQPPYTFSGVLLAVRRKGPDSSILLRNVVRKTGVEMRVFLASPTLKGIKVVQRAGGSILRLTNPDFSPATTTSSATSGEGASKSKGKKKAKGSSSSSSKLSANDKIPKGWKVGTSGPVPTLRAARMAGIIPRGGKGQTKEDREGAVVVDEQDTVFSKRARRARLYFLRDYPSKMSAISAGISKRER